MFFVLLFHATVFFVVFLCGKVFFSVFSPQNVFFFLYHAGESQVLQFNITIFGFLGTSFINLL